MLLRNMTFNYAGGQTHVYRMASCGLAESSFGSFRLQDDLPDYAFFMIIDTCITIIVHACTMIIVMHLAVT